jgi:hypothetical protein
VVRITKCQICRFFSEKPYRNLEKEFFEKKAREGVSLRELSLLLESYGLKIGKDAISKHIRECLPSEIREQREAEKERKAKESKSLFKKIGFKIKDFVSPQGVQECSHNQGWIEYFDLLHEEVVRLCSSCRKEILRYDPEEDSRRIETNPRNMRIYESLTRRKK